MTQITGIFLSTASDEQTSLKATAEFVSEIAEAESIEVAFESLSRAVETMGFEAIVYSAYPLTLNASKQLAPVFLASPGFSGGFLKHYQDADLARHDFTIERIRAGCLDVMDWGEECRRGKLSSEQRAVVDVARFDYGIREAVSIPTWSDEHLIAGASVVCSETFARAQLLKRERVETLTALVRIFHRWAFSMPEHRRLFYSMLLDQFTEDEIKVIKLVVGGHRLKSSWDRCGLSPSRAGNVLSSLYRRLGISNAHELAYLVGVHQLARLL